MPEISELLQKLAFQRGYRWRFTAINIANHAVEFSNGTIKVGCKEVSRSLAKEIFNKATKTKESQS